MKLKLFGDLSDGSKGISVYNYLTHRNLRFFLTIFLFRSYSWRKFRPNLSFSYRFTGIVYVIAIFFYFLFWIWVSYDIGYNEKSCTENCGLSMFIWLIIFYYFLLHFFFPFILPLHWFLGNLTVGIESDVAMAMENASLKSKFLENTLKDLYFLRSEMLEAQNAGIDLGSIADEIEFLENNFVNEAKQNISIEEIAKLQEEFINGLNPKDTL